MAEKLGNTQAEVFGADKTHEKSDTGKTFAELFSKDNIGKAFTELFFKDNDEESTLFIKCLSCDF